MEAVISLNELTPRELNWINNWRFYYRVINLSDLTDATGRVILKCYRIRH